MNVIDYIAITCNLKNVRLQITIDYMKNVINYNRLQLQITITPCLGESGIKHHKSNLNLNSKIATLVP
jgi:hypothetical protein